MERKSDYEPEWAVPAAVLLTAVIVFLAVMFSKQYLLLQIDNLIRDGISAGREEHFKQSEEALDLAVKKCPDCFLARFNRGILYVATERFDDAVKELDAAIEIKPDDNKSWYVRAQVLSLTGKKDEAIKSLEKSIDLGFNDIPMLNDDEAFVPLHGQPNWNALWKRWYLKRYGKEPE